MQGLCVPSIVACVNVAAAVVNVGMAGVSVGVGMAPGNGDGESLQDGAEGEDHGPCGGGKYRDLKLDSDDEEEEEEEEEEEVVENGSAEGNRGEKSKGKGKGKGGDKDATVLDDSNGDNAEKTKKNSDDKEKRS